MQSKTSEKEEEILKDYDEWHRGRKAADGAGPLSHPWYQMVWASLACGAGGRMLEVGCGRGGFANWLSRQKPELRITGLDFSSSAVEIARESAQEEKTNVEFVVGDAEALPFADGEFDLVVSCECMEHVPQPPQMARELARVLKPGGRFCLTTPSYLNGMVLAWMMSLLRCEPFNSGAGVQPRENFYFYWNVQRYLRDVGLKTDMMESCNYQWLLLPRVAPARLCTMRFENALARR